MANINKYLSIYDLALYNAWLSSGNSTNWFFYVDDNESDSDEDNIGNVVNKAVKGSVKMTKFYIGNVIEFSTKYLLLHGMKAGELDDTSVLKGILSSLAHPKSDDGTEKEPSLGTFIVAWSTVKGTYTRGKDEIPRYCGSLTKHRDLLDKYGYYFNTDDCVLLESMDGVLVPILLRDVPEDSIDKIDADKILQQLKAAYQESTIPTVKL